MKFDLPRMIGMGALVVVGAYTVVGAGIQRHYDPGEGSITSPKDVGYFLGVTIGDTGKAAGNVFLQEELTEKGAIYQPNAIREEEFCFVWDSACKESNTQREYQRQQREQYERRRNY